MSGEKEKKGFWSNLFRSQSSAKRSGRLEKERPRRASEGDLLHRRRTGSPPPPEAGASSSRRRPRRPDPGAPAGGGKGKGKGKGRAHEGGYDGGEAGPLTEWPPAGVAARQELTLGQAMELVARGVPAHRGHRRAIPHASDAYYALFTTSAGNHSDEGDGAAAQTGMTQLMTMRVKGPGSAAYPWETLEQPSYAFYFGCRPGTVTLNAWAAKGSVLPAEIALRDSGVVPREVDLAQVFARLKYLQGGLEDDDEDLMYKNLYKRLLRDPDRLLSPHRGLDKQIMDLIMVLSRPDWIDFPNLRNQIVTRFIFDTGHANHQQYVKFFHQLLLSMELDLRINSRHHDDWAKEKLMKQLPPTIQWNVALSRRWKDNVRVEEYGKTADQIRLRLKLKGRQIRMLRHFAKMMKWPNLAETVDTLKQRDADGSLDSISSHAMAFFSGLVLPGPTFPFLIMNSLIDVDPDKATDDLALLTHLHPNCGFQYRNSYTYWTSTSIVGKVLAPTCHEAAGWVGPARPTPDLARSQIARVRSRRPRQPVLTPDDARTMGERSDPLGPPAEVFPVHEYALVAPAADDAADDLDLVRIELLHLTPTKRPPGEPDDAPRTFDAAMQFAIDGASWPLRLMFDVVFVGAWPCSGGPHPLFFDYAFAVVRADEVVGVSDWAGLGGSGSAAGSDEGRSAASSPRPGGSKRPAGAGAGAGRVVDKEGDEEKVLVVEAFGVPDNEVLARAWCAHWGLSAVVADVGKTCMACAIREAYAATLTVVILVEDRDDVEDD